MVKKGKPIKAAPTWRQKLAEHNINQIYDGRTCQVILMAELTPIFSESITLFHQGSKSYPTSVVKSINCEALLSELKEATTATPKDAKEKGKSKVNPHVALMRSAATEALTFLASDQPIPVELTAKLLKLKIISMVMEDVKLRDEERLLEIQKLQLKVDGDVDNKNKRKKENKAKGNKKGKAKAPPLPKEERILYFLLNGFYDLDLPEELCKIKIALCAILELASPDYVFVEKCLQTIVSKNSSSDGLESLDVCDKMTVVEAEDEELVLYVNTYYEPTSKDSFGVAALAGEQSFGSVSSVAQAKIDMLNKFWSKIYKQLEGELRAEFLESTAHIRVTPWSEVCPDKEPQGCGNQALDVFAKIVEEVMKIPGVLRQHDNYLRHLSIRNVGPEAVDLSVETLKTYRKIMEVIPPDCFTIGLLMHCLLEEVNTRVPQPLSKQRKKEHNSSTSTVELMEAPLEQHLTSSSNEDVREPLLKNLADYVLQYRKLHWPLCRTTITDYRKPTIDPKTKLDMCKKSFTIHETNWLEFKLNSYQQLSTQLLEINLESLKRTPAALFFQDYPRLSPVEIIYRNQHLQTWNHLLDLPLDKLRYALIAIELDSLVCQAPKHNQKSKTDLQIFCAGKNDSAILEIAQPKVKYMETPEMSLNNVLESDSEQDVLNVAYSNYPNIYEAKNVGRYRWYEDLTPIVLLQQLQKASCNYICVDHKYSPYTDSLVLRYHNDVDGFGINSQIWSQSVRTPICFRDFCKYVIHKESEWLEKEDEDYHEKLKQTAREARKLANETTNEEVPKTDAQVNPGSKPTETLAKIKDRCAKPGEPYTFLAYDLVETRVQLTGATTTFHSMDGYKITVDRTNLIGRPSNLSLNLALARHNFILHYNQLTITQPLTFHFVLSNGTIIVFSKPVRHGKTDASIAETIYKRAPTKPKTNLTSAYQRRPKFMYYVTEKQYSLKCLKTPFVARRSFLVAENLMLPFMERIKSLSSHSTFSIPTNSENVASTLSENDKKRLNTSWNDSKNIHTLYASPNGRKNHLKIDEKLDAFTIDSATLISAANRSKECRKILRKIHEAKKLQIPLFKVYSSRLHKFEYIKRTKSHISIKIKKHTLSLLCKPPCHKTSRDVQVVKVFPLKLSNQKWFNNSTYDMKTSFPSGLLIYTVPSTEPTSFNIKQRYIEKGPQHKNIIDEDSRTYTRDGHAIVKKRDGTLTIYTPNGHVISCEIPYSSEKIHRKYRRKTNLNHPFHPLQTFNQSKTTNFEATLLGIANRNRKHIIAGPESRYFRYRRLNLRAHRLQNKTTKQVYVVQDQQGPLLEYTLMTQEGKKFKVTDLHVKKQDEIFYTMQNDENLEECMFLRDDGTISLLYGGGILATQYSDQTRISSWFTEASEFEYFEDEKSSGTESGSFEEYCQSEEWVVVQMFYKFEHPNYATVLYNSDTFETEINLPNRVVLSVTEKGDYYLDIDQNLSAVVNDELLYLELRPCKTCMQRSFCVLNVKPLYQESHPIACDTELLKSCDSFEKIFVVNYNGRCFRNTNFVKRRSNRVDCHEHDSGDYQQLFVLKRDLSGSKLWNTKTYRDRFIRAAANSNTVMQYYGKNNQSLEMRTYQYEPYHQHFLNQNFVPDFMLASYQFKPNPTLPAYTTTLHLRLMPDLAEIDMLESSMRNKDDKRSEFPQSDDHNVPCKCISQIAREEMRLQEEKEVSDSTTDGPLIASAVSLQKRWSTWQELIEPYIPSQKTCTCKTNSTNSELQRLPKLGVKLAEEDDETLKLVNKSSVEVLDRVSTDSFVTTYRKPSKSACACHVPAEFVCECEREFLEEHYDPESRRKLSSIRRWSEYADFTDMFVTDDQTTKTFPTGKSISDTILQSFNTLKCDYNTQSTKPRVKSDPQQKCTELTLTRQAGGEDFPLLSARAVIVATNIQHRCDMKRLQRKLDDRLIVTNAKKSSASQLHCKRLQKPNNQNEAVPENNSVFRILNFSKPNNASKPNVLQNKIKLNNKKPVTAPENTKSKKTRQNANESRNVKLTNRNDAINRLIQKSTNECAFETKVQQSIYARQLKQVTKTKK